jgi:hypothetical protein
LLWLQALLQHLQLWLLLAVVLLRQHQRLVVRVYVGPRRALPMLSLSRACSMLGMALVLL